MRRIVKNAVIGKRKSTITILCGVVLSFVVFFASCDPAVEYEKIVQNDSDFDVTITTYRPDSIFNISKKTTTVLYYDLEHYPPRDNCGPYDSMSMSVYFGDSVKVIPDFNNSNNWIPRTIKETGLHSIYECRIRLTNEMLTKW